MLFLLTFIIHNDLIIYIQEQYEFVYEVIRELVLKELRKCDENFDNCSPEATYENIQFVLKVKEFYTWVGC